MPTPVPTVEPTAVPTVEPTVEPTPTPVPAIRISKCSFEIKDQVYSGKALKPLVVVKYGKTTLKKNRDYTVSYKNNINVGMATALVTGKGGFTGSKKVTFPIVPKAPKLGKLTADKGQFTATWTALVAQVDGYQIEYSLK